MLVSTVILADSGYSCRRVRQLLGRAKGEVSSTAAAETELLTSELLQMLYDCTVIKYRSVLFIQLAAATDRIGSLQEEQQQLKQQNELIRERSEKSVEVGHLFRHDEDP